VIKAGNILPMTKIKIIGLGNSLGGDDAVGNLIARQLLPYQGPLISIMEGGLAGLNLLHEMEGTEKLILIDAVHSQAEAGTIVRFLLPQELDEISTMTWGSSIPSTHAFGLGEALILAHTLEMLPQHVILYGIELGHIQPGKTLSPQVSRSIQSVVFRIVTEELRPSTCTNSN
jgi:hydrogenase maturation protease